jgi:hypothetical protein
MHETGIIITLLLLARVASVFNDQDIMSRIQNCVNSNTLINIVRERKKNYCKLIRGNSRFFGTSPPRIPEGGWLYGLDSRRAAFIPRAGQKGPKTMMSDVPNGIWKLKRE